MSNNASRKRLFSHVSESGVLHLCLQHPAAAGATRLPAAALMPKPKKERRRSLRLGCSFHHRLPTTRRTERDATNWSTDKLKALLLGLSVENEDGTCEVTEVSKLEGEASINNRKGKLIFFYEWNVKAAWTGEFKVQQVPLSRVARWFCLLVFFYSPEYFGSFD